MVITTHPIRWRTGTARRLQAASEALPTSSDSGNDPNVVELQNRKIRQLAWNVAAAVPDPEIPALTVAELGILRSVDVTADGTIIARLSPTYSGCPAVSVIEQSVEEALNNAGFRVHVERVLSPPWTTDWITEQGHRKLKAYGIAPPVSNKQSQNNLFADPVVACPKCNSETTVKVSEFGSTACKAHYKCQACNEPFDYFKCL